MNFDGQDLLARTLSPSVAGSHCKHRLSASPCGPGHSATKSLPQSSHRVAEGRGTRFDTSLKGCDFGNARSA